MTNQQFLIVTLIGTNIVSYMSGRAIAKAYEEEKIQKKRLWETGRYLLDILEKHDIELSDFDVIALSALTKEKDAS